MTKDKCFGILAMIYNTYGEWHYLVFVTRKNVCVKLCERSRRKIRHVQCVEEMRIIVLYIVSLVLRAVE